MAKYQVIVPYIPDMGSVSGFFIKSTRMESKEQAALWEINSMRDHDGLPHIHRMPAGTRYEIVR